MRFYELTKSTEADLEEITRYTIEQWGEQKAEGYLRKLSKCFQKIADHEIVSRTFSKLYPQVFVTRCEHHFVFYLHTKGKPPIILAVLHERMNMLTRLTERLG